MTRALPLFALALALAGCNSGPKATPLATTPVEARDAQDATATPPAASADGGPVMTATAPPNLGSDPPGLKRILHPQLCVTRGEMLPGSAAGHIQVDHPKTRCVLGARTGQVAEIHFTYLGPTDHDEPLASGQIRRQIGLKLRAANGCNVVYAMWRIEPKSELVVSVKSNPGMRTSAECGNRGYTNIKPQRASPVPTLSAGASHSMRAELAGDAMKVTVDGAVVWEGNLGPEALAFDGPVGMRTDNGRFDVEFFTAVDPKSPPPPCGRGESSDEP